MNGCFIRDDRSFRPFGVVTGADVAIDHKTGLSRGFGFVI